MPMRLEPQPTLQYDAPKEHADSPKSKRQKRKPSARAAFRLEEIPQSLKR